MKKNFVIIIPVAIMLLALLAELLLPRQNSFSPSTGDETWLLGAGDQQITASFQRDGEYGYALTLEGTGAIPDFSSAKDAPWYGVSGRISQIAIGAGVTEVGDNAFAACENVQMAVIPESVNRLGSQAFSERTKLLAYQGISVPEGVELCLYSEHQSEGGGWHFRDGMPEVWDTVKILFIGNSFTYTFDIDALLSKIAWGADVGVDIQRIAIGAHNLSQFADPADKGGAMVEEALNGAKDFDIIVLQEQSTRPLTNPDLFLDGARRLKEKIDMTQEDCQIYLYATWGYPKYAGTQAIPEMESEIRAAYAKAAEELGVKISNVGTAFTAVYQEYPEIDLYSGDQQHPSYAGAYLSACTHAAALLGIDPRESDFQGFPLPENPHAGDPIYANDVTFTEETAEILQNVAYATVFAGESKK